VLFSKAKASQNRSEKQPQLIFNLRSLPNPPEVNISMADLSLSPSSKLEKNRGQEDSSKQQEHIRYLSKPFSKQTISSW
jgi:hypothetical protein